MIPIPKFWSGQEVMVCGSLHEIKQIVPTWRLKEEIGLITDECAEFAGFSYRFQHLFEPIPESVLLNENDEIPISSL